MHELDRRGEPFDERVEVARPSHAPPRDHRLEQGRDIGGGPEDVGSDETRRGLGGVYYNPRTNEFLAYKTRRLPLGMGLSLVAGGLSGLLGVGGGILKVPAMNLAMGIPIRVAAATSNFMIGVTAAASLVIYVQRGFLVPLVAAPVALGVAAGALAGTVASPKVSSALLARIFGILLLVIAVQTLVRALGVGRV